MIFLPWSAITLTLFPYYTACSSGFPSVHSNHFVYLKHNIVQGVRAHYELLRLYEMAADCSSLWSKGKIRTMDENMVSDGNNNKTTSSIVAQQTTAWKATINMARQVLNCWLVEEESRWLPIVLPSGPRERYARWMRIWSRMAITTKQRRPLWHNKQQHEKLQSIWRDNYWIADLSRKSQSGDEQ